MKGFVIAFVLVSLAFQVGGAVDLKPVAGLEVGWSIMDSGIKDVRGDSVPKSESGTPKELDNNLLWGAGLYGGVSDERIRLTCYGNFYSLLAEDKKGFEASGETVKEALLRAYAVSPLISYHALATRTDNISLWLETGYRYYVIHGVLRMSDSSGVSRTYENGYNKYHNWVLGPTLEMKFTPKLGLTLAYDRYVGWGSGDNYYMAFSWFNKDTPLTRGNIFLKWIHSRGHYDALYLGLSGDSGYF